MSEPPPPPPIDKCIINSRNLKIFAGIKSHKKILGKQKEIPREQENIGKFEIITGALKNREGIF